MGTSRLRVGLVGARARAFVAGLRALSKKNLSLPSPPPSLSLPAPPCTASLPPPPLNTSFPPRPKSVFLAPLPTIVFAPALPKPSIDALPVKVRASTLTGSR